MSACSPTQARFNCSIGQTIAGMAIAIGIAGLLATGVSLILWTQGRISLALAILITSLSCDLLASLMLLGVGDVFFRLVCVGLPAGLVAAFFVMLALYPTHPEASGILGWSLLCVVIHALSFFHTMCWNPVK